MEIKTNDCVNYLCLGERDTKNIRELENKVLDGLKKYSPREIEVSSMICPYNLRKCGSFISMPQNITAISNIKKEQLEHVSKENNIEKNDVMFSNIFLSPASCLNFYPMLENTYCENMVVTFRNKSYRYELGDFSEKTRFWEFSNREIVVVGDEKYVLSTLEEIKNILGTIFESLCPEIRLKEGTDAFFPTKSNLKMKKIQYINKLKYEFVASIDGKDVAMASINYHNTHFSRPFGFDREGYIKTGCVGLGLDRWAKLLSTLYEEKGIL